MNRCDTSPLFPAGLSVRLSGLNADALIDTSRDLGWDLDYTRLHRRPLLGDRRVAHTPHIQLCTCRYNDGAMIAGQIPRGTVLLFAIPGEPLSWHNRGVLHGPEDLHLVTDRDTIDFFQKRGCTHYMAVMEREWFQARFGAFFGAEAGEVFEGSTLRIERGRLGRFRRQVEGWLDLLSRPEMKSLKSEAYRSLEEEICDTFFAHLVVPKEPVRKENAPSLLERARDLLHQTVREHYTIADLARDLRVSERSLQYLFKNRLGVTPKQYQQAIRMDAIHKILRAADEGVRVGDVALEHGFLHLGHFVEQYKRYFGELPSRTLRSK